MEPTPRNVRIFSVALTVFAGAFAGSAGYALDGVGAAIFIGALAIGGAVIAAIASERVLLREKEKGESRGPTIRARTRLLKSGFLLVVLGLILGIVTRAVLGDLNLVAFLALALLAVVVAIGATAILFRGVSHR